MLAKNRSNQRQKRIGKPGKKVLDLSRKEAPSRKHKNIKANNIIHYKLLL
ncbi:hypothetical protein PORCRE_451 [Porphyromonas crevioricanis JCM 15906]|uniref:Uncharacterized protein n=1 Tax=Porphyromonas crevioricanis JCM 15906 TaxID=1305617 RepID=T1DQH6_9PORP|nr:hypothetical protein PORCRE_451 [Porphyromonas crevioricanis JCM 15906]GAD08208.1 hypothetical protein PORCAN_1844 [Porphyromonas crevioricanis JCM 13913]